MGSTSRSLRRKSQTKDKGASLRQAMGSLQTILQQTNLEDLSKLPIVIRNLEAQTNRAAQLADALAEDYETLLGRIEALEKQGLEDIPTRVADLERAIFGSAREP